MGDSNVKPPIQPIRISTSGRLPKIPISQRELVNHYGSQWIAVVRKEVLSNGPNGRRGVGRRHRQAAI